MTLINSRIKKLVMAITFVLKKCGSIEKFKDKLKNIGSVSREMILSLTKSQSAAKFKLPKDLSQKILLLDFAKECIISLIIQMNYNSSTINDNFLLWKDRLGSIPDTNTITSNDLSMFDKLNFSTCEQFKDSVSHSGTNPLAKVYGLFNN
jgi:hypothetical protein